MTQVLHCFTQSRTNPMIRLCTTYIGCHGKYGRVSVAVTYHETLPPRRRHPSRAIRLLLLQRVVSGLLPEAPEETPLLPGPFFSCNKVHI